MKDIRFIFRDAEFLQEAEAFTQSNFLKHNRRLLNNHQNNQQKAFPNDWTSLKDIFWEKQGKRCCLCEKELNDIYSTDVEHFRPKGHYWWLAYNYSNYYLACAECNRSYKHIEFPLLDENNRVNYETRHLVQFEQPLLINPAIDNPYDYFELFFTIHPNTNKKVVILRPLQSLPNTDFRYQKAQTTIEILNLNLNQYLEKSDKSRHELMRKFYLDLIDLAKNRSNLEKNDFKQFWLAFRQEKPAIAELGLSKMILKGQFEIAGFLK